MTKGDSLIEGMLLEKSLSLKLRDFFLNRATEVLLRRSDLRILILDSYVVKGVRYL